MSSPWKKIKNRWSPANLRQRWSQYREERKEYQRAKAAVKEGKDKSRKTQFALFKARFSSPKKKSKSKSNVEDASGYWERAEKSLERKRALANIALKERERLQAAKRAERQAQRAKQASNSKSLGLRGLYKSSSASKRSASKRSASKRSGASKSARAKKSKSVIPAGYFELMESHPNDPFGY